MVDRSEAPIGDGRRRCKHVGSSLDEFLAADGTSAEVEGAALKRVIAWQVERGMDEKKISKSEMARAMRTSPAAPDRRFSTRKTNQARYERYHAP